MEKTKPNKVDCNSGNWCDGETQAVITVILEGQFSNWEEALCKKCLTGLLQENPQAFWVAEQSNDQQGLGVS